MPTITANIKTEETVKKARRIALDAGVSLREWAGSIIESKVEKQSKHTNKKTK